MRQVWFLPLPVSVNRCSTQFQPSAPDVTNTSQLIALLNKSILFLSQMKMFFPKWQLCFGRAGLSDGVQEVYSSFLLGRQICVVNRTQPCLLTHFCALDGLHILKLQLTGENYCVWFSNLKRFVCAFRPTLYHWAEITTARKQLCKELSVRFTRLSFTKMPTLICYTLIG